MSVLRPPPTVRLPFRGLRPRRSVHGGRKEAHAKGCTHVLVASIAAVSLALAQVLSVSAAPVRFGAKLTTDTQPQPALWCDEPNEDPPHPTCTWVMNEAYGRPSGGHKAPKAGTIGKVRLMSCEPGSLKVQVARRVRGT